MQREIASDSNCARWRIQMERAGRVQFGIVYSFDGKK